MIHKKEILQFSYEILIFAHDKSFPEIVSLEMRNTILLSKWRHMLCLVDIIQQSNYIPLVFEFALLRCFVNIHPVY